jgi:hypothetical protein
MRFIVDVPGALQFEIEASRASDSASAVLPPSSAAPISPLRAPDNAIRPSLPAASSHSRRNSGRPWCWFSR